MAARFRHHAIFPKELYIAARSSFVPDPKLLKRLCPATGSTFTFSAARGDNPRSCLLFPPNASTYGKQRDPAPVLPHRRFVAEPSDCLSNFNSHDFLAQGVQPQPPHPRIRKFFFAGNVTSSGNVSTNNTQEASSSPMVVFALSSLLLFETFRPVLVSDEGHERKHTEASRWCAKEHYQEEQRKDSKLWLIAAASMVAIPYWRPKERRRNDRLSYVPGPIRAKERRPVEGATNALRRHPRRGTAKVTNVPGIIGSSKEAGRNKPSRLCLQSIEVPTTHNESSYFRKSLRRKGAAASLLDCGQRLSNELLRPIGSFAGSMSLSRSHYFFSDDEKKDTFFKLKKKRKKRPHTTRAPEDEFVPFEKDNLLVVASNEDVYRLDANGECVVAAVVAVGFRVADEF